jgi:1-acyl-sn-glycerol-3-phosphate acyltransferase
MRREKLKVIWYWLARWGCRVLCIFFFRFRAYGMENIPQQGPFILASNHQSYLDPIFCGVAMRRRLHFVARDSLFTNRFFAGLIRSVNAIPVRRGQADIASIRRVIAKLNDGEGVCLFPEATRTSDGRIADFKPGFGLLCKKTNAIIVPVLIDGAFECWPRYKRIFSPGAVSICYGQAIKAEHLKGVSDNALADILTRKVRQMQEQYRSKRGQQPYNYQ